MALSVLNYLTRKTMVLTHALNARGDASQLSIMDDVGEMVFEAGELGDAIKKRRRGQLGFVRKRNPVSEEEAMLKIKKEAGDVFMCFLRVCHRLDIDPYECIKMKYNILVDEENVCSPITDADMEQWIESQKVDNFLSKINPGKTDHPK